MSNKIQLITYPPINIDNFPNIEIARFNGFYSLDSFDYNLIDLNISELLNYNFQNHTFTKEKDFQSLKINLDDSKDCKIILALPQNLYFTNKGEIKNNLNKVYAHISKFYTLSEFKLIFGKNNTKIGGNELNADFYLSDFSQDCELITKNDNGNVTSIQYEDIIYTTLKFENEYDIYSFIQFVEELNNEIEAPAWFSEVKMFDDEEHLQLIEENSNKINELQLEIDNALNKLDKNNEYKSILYKQSKPLEDSVRAILQELLSYDLSDFVDIGEEDFLIKFDNVTFIGEIKGVGKNITNNHLSKLDLHFTRRQDKVPNENLKPILIVNRFINRPPEDREPINHQQIEFAETKYKCLIIDSYELLKLFEKFKNHEITTEEIIQIFDEEIGLFEI